MKKLTSWVQIIFCLLILSAFAITLILVITEVLTNNSDVSMSIKEMLTSSIGFLIAISILILLLIDGIKKVKKEKITKIVNFDKNLNIDLKGQIEYHDYRNLILGLSFKKPMYFVAIGIIFLLLLSVFAKEDNTINQFDSNYLLFIITGTLFIITPLLSIRQIRKIYKTNKTFQEKLSYVLTNDSIHIKGDTVDSTIKWVHFYQVRVTKSFFMFYDGEASATLLNKKMFSEEELQEFQDFIKSLNMKRM